MFASKTIKVLILTKVQDTTDNFAQAVIAMDRHLGFMVSSATALVKFLCDIGKNLVKKTRSDKLKAPDAGNNI